jgi:hypothetical protein
MNKKYSNNNNGASPKVNSKPKAPGLIPPERIGEILAATKDNPELIDYLLRSLVANPRRIAVAYHGSYCRLLDYHLSPKRPDLPLVVSRYSGALLSESWGKYRGGYSTHGIFDVAAVILDRTAKRDFPIVYRRVREAYNAFKREPVASEAERRARWLESVQGTKERLFLYCEPFFGLSIRRSPTARALWKKLSPEIKEEEFGGSAKTFLDFLKYLAFEDLTEKPFRVSEHRYATGNRNSRFLFRGKNTS